MRFVFINTGAKRQNAGIIRCLGFGVELVKSGHHVTVILSNRRENLKEYGYAFRGVDFVYTSSGLFMEEIGKVSALLKMDNVDVVHCMGAGTNIFIPALLAHRVFRKKFLLVVDHEDKQSLLVPRHKMRWQSFLNWLSVTFADVVICASRALAEEYRRRYSGKVFHIPLGFSLDEKRRTSPVSTPSSRGEICLGYMGSLIPPYKDQVLFLLDSMPDVIEHHGNVKLHIIGDGAMRYCYERIVAERGLCAFVRFHGYVGDADLQSLLQTMDVLVFPFPDTPLNRYRCPNKAFIYAGTGLPVITNPVGEVLSLLGSYPLAYFFEENDKASFRDALARALSGSFTGDLRDYYRQRSWGVLARTYMDVLRTVRQYSAL